MMIPVRCFTCGGVIGNKYEEYTKRVKDGESPDKVLDKLDVKRYCCRRMFLGHVNSIDEVIKYGRH